MAQRIPVPGPDPFEEMRQLALTVADGHEILGMVVEQAPLLISGDAVAEVGHAWPASNVSMKRVVDDIVAARARPPKPGPITSESLENAELIGPTGEAKRNLARRCKDRVMKFWYDAIAGSKKALRKLREHLDEYLDALKAIVGSIPGAEMVEELIDLVQMAVHLKSKAAG